MSTRLRRRLVSRRVSLRVRTALWRPLPDFLIIGAQRCGTSSLYKYLGGHPQVIPSLRKEVEYFSTAFVEGESWYRAHFPLSFRKRISERMTGRPVFSFEATPDYLLDPRAAGRAAQVLPEARIVALFRNPTDRAYSQYLHNRSLGHEPLTFDEALDREAERLDGEIEKLMEDEAYPARALRRYSYVTRGLYAGQISRWLAEYPEDRVLMLRFEDLVESPAATLRRIEGFLGIAEWVPDLFHNYSYRPGTSRSSSGLDPVLRHRLDSVFEPYNAELATRINPALAWPDHTDAEPA